VIGIMVQAAPAVASPTMIRLAPTVPPATSRLRAVA
jgi:hypothetical protein